MKTRVLRQIRQKLLRGDSLAHDVAARDRRRAAVGLCKAGQQPHGRGFAGAVGADEECDLTRAGAE
ncbi:MAG: hypothetical protein WCA06_17235 [Terrimicrobiaceae bacterium]